MNNSIHRISLNIHDNESQASISAKNGDTARSIYITLTENGKPYRISEGCNAVFTARKPDGTYLFNECTIHDNIIIYEFTEQTVPVAGRIHCEITLYDANNDRITSPRFDIIVDNAVYNDEDIVSSDEAAVLISATIEAKNATSEAKAVTAEVEQKLASGEFVGEKGDKGDRGEKGETGDTGPQGIQGPQGLTGATGPRGLKGEQGDKGDKGDIGPTGPQGEQGPQGEPGEDYILTEGDKADIAALVLANFTDVSEVGA